MDDIEFGCGGLISELSDSNTQILLAVLSVSNKDSKDNIILQRDVNEAYASLDVLGLKRSQLYLGNCFGQIFDIEQQKMREELLHLRELFHPDLVFFPSKNDVHQDHFALSNNAFRIFRNRSCLGYEVVRSSFDFHPHVFMELTEESVNKKISSIMCYSSQMHESAAYYFDEDLIKSTTIFRGGQIGVRFAEAFECYRWINQKK